MPSVILVHMANLNSDAIFAMDVSMAKSNQIAPYVNHSKNANMVDDSSERLCAKSVKALQFACMANTESSARRVVEHIHV